MILISILGKFDSSVFPILYEFKNDIKKHIIIHDDSKFETRKSNKFLKTQKLFKKNYDLNYETLSLKIDEDSYVSLNDCYEKIKYLVQKNFKRVYFNGTGGLASTTVVLSPRLLENGATFVAYDIFDNGYNLVTKNSMRQKNIINSIDIYTHLLLKGYTLLSSGKKIAANSRKMVIYKLCENLEYLRNFATKLHNQKAEDIQGYDDIKEYLRQINKINDVSFVQGTIFEEYIFWLIVDNFDFDDVRFNVKINFADGVSNEFDILMIKDNHLHAIECKLRSSINGEAYVYKMDSIIDYIDDDGKAMIIAIGGENVKTTKYGNKKVQFSNGALKRAEESKIKIHQYRYFDKGKFLVDIEKHFLD